MKTHVKFATVMVVFLVFGACNPTKYDSNKNEFEHYIELPAYVTLAEKSLDYLANFELESFAEMLADTVEYKLPDGTEMIGKTALIDYWEGFKVSSGIVSMKIVNANYLPIHSNLKLKSGVKVLANFNSDMIFNERKISIKMNFSMHFNQEKLIDRITTDYDETQITQKQ